MLFSRQSCLTVASVALLFLAVSSARAVDFSKPSAVGSFSGYNQAIAELNSLGQATGQPGMGSGLDMMAKMMVKGIDAIDPSRPWGFASYYSEETEPNRPSPFIIFVPVSDMAKFVAMLEGFGMKGEQISEGYYKFSAAQTGETAKEDPMFVKQQGNWVLIGPREVPFDSVSIDPSSLLAGLDQKYLLALQINGQNDGIQWIEGAIGESMRAATVGQQFAALSASGKSPEEIAEIMKNMPAPKFSLADLGPNGASLAKMAEQVDTLTLGILFDKDGDQMKDLQIDLQVKALPGTDLAKEMDASTEQASDFAGFYNTAAAFTLNLSQSMTEETIAQVKQRVLLFRQLAIAEIAQEDLNDDELEMAKDWIARFAKMIEATADQGQHDSGLEFQYTPGASTVLFGIKVVDGKELDAMLRQLNEMILASEEKEETPASVVLDVDSVGEVQFHKLQAEFSELDALFGAAPEVILGVSDDALYVGIGKNATAGLKAAIQKSKSMSSEKVLPSRIAVDIPQVLKLVNDSAPDGEAVIPPNVLAMFGSKKGNQVVLSTVPIEGGMIQRLEISPSIIGNLFKSAQGMMMPGMPSGGGMPGGMPMMPMPR